MAEPTPEEWGRLTDEDRTAIMEDPVTGPLVAGWQGNGLPVVRGDYAVLCRALQERGKGAAESEPPIEEEPPRRRGPGRPRKNSVPDKPRRGPGRPRKRVD